MIFSCIFCIDLFGLCVVFLTGFVNCLVKQFAIALGVIVILLLNVWSCSVGYTMYSLPKSVCVFFQ